MKFKICNLDKPNRNGVIYTKDCLEKYDGYNVPIKILDSNDVVGTCRVHTKDYPSMEITDVHINNEELKSLLEKEVIQMGLCGKGIRNEDGTISDYILHYLGLTDNCSQSFEIVKED